MAEPSTGPVTELDVLRRQATKGVELVRGTVSDVSAGAGQLVAAGDRQLDWDDLSHVVINTDVEINRLISTENRSSRVAGVATSARSALRPARGSTVGCAMSRSIGTYAVRHAIQEAFLDSLDDLTDGHLGDARRRYFHPVWGCGKEGTCTSSTVRTTHTSMAARSPVSRGLREASAGRNRGRSAAAIV